MKAHLQNLVRASLAAGLTMLATVNALGQDDSVGLVRISRPKSAPVAANPDLLIVAIHGTRNAD